MSKVRANKNTDWAPMQEMRNEGYTLKEIAEASGISRATLGLKLEVPEDFDKRRKKLKESGEVPKKKIKVSNRELLGKGIAKIAPHEKVFETKVRGPERAVRVDHKTWIYVKLDDKRSDEEIIQSHKEREKRRKIQTFKRWD